jgi:RNA polymerase sigma factor (sigma-70 family)
VEITILNKLIEKCKHNDRASQEMLYRHYFPIMYRVVRKMVADEHDLVSIVNDGFVKVFQYIDKYNPKIGVFDAWIHTIVVNAAYDHLRKSKKRIPITEMIVEREVPDNGHLFIINPEEINHLIIKLPNTTGKVLGMSVDGYTHKEIAAHLGITEISSRWHLSEARRQVREILQLKRNLS